MLLHRKSLAFVAPSGENTSQSAYGKWTATSSAKN